MVPEMTNSYSVLLYQRQLLWSKETIPKYIYHNVTPQDPLHLFVLRTDSLAAALDLLFQFQSQKR